MPQPLITDENYLHDKIKISFRGLNLYRYREGFQATKAFLEELKNRGENQISDGKSLFNEVKSGVKCTLTTKSTTSRNNPAPYRPLFSFQINALYDLASDNRQQDRTALKGYIYLNPTRFMRHWLKRHHYLPLRAQNFDLIPLDELFTPETIVHHFEQEIASASHDNVILNPLQRRIIDAENRDYLLSLYVRSVLFIISDLINTSADAHQFSRSGQLNFTLNSVETYWEETYEDVYYEMQHLEKTLQRAGKNTQKRYSASSSRSDRDNERSFSIEPNKATTLSVYTKTNRRIRYEVRQQCGSMAGVFSTDNSETLTSLIQEASEQAVATALQHLPFLTTEEHVPPTIREILDFILQFQRNFPNTEYSSYVLNLLIENGHIEMRSLPSNFKNAVRNLTRRHVLKITTHGVRAIDDQYQNILEELRNLRTTSSQE